MLRHGTEENSGFTTSNQEPTGKTFDEPNLHHSSSEVFPKPHPYDRLKTLNEPSYNINLNANSHKQISVLKRNLETNPFNVDDNGWNKTKNIHSDKQYKNFFEDKDKRDYATALFQHFRRKTDNQRNNTEKSEFIKKQRGVQKDLLRKRTLERLALCEEAQQAMIEKVTNSRTDIIDELAGLDKKKKVALTMSKSTVLDTVSGNANDNLWNKYTKLNEKEQKKCFTNVAIKMEEESVNRILSKIKKDNRQKEIEHIQKKNIITENVKARSKYFNPESSNMSISRKDYTIKKYSYNENTNDSTNGLPMINRQSNNSSYMNLNEPNDAVISRYDSNFPQSHINSGIPTNNSRQNSSYINQKNPKRSTLELTKYLSEDERLCSEVSQRSGLLKLFQEIKEKSFEQMESMRSAINSANPSSVEDRSLISAKLKESCLDMQSSVQKRELSSPNNLVQRQCCPFKCLHHEKKVDRLTYDSMDFRGMNLPKIKDKIVYVEANPLINRLSQKSKWLQDRRGEIFKKDDQIRDAKRMLSKNSIPKQEKSNTKYNDSVERSNSNYMQSNYMVRAFKFKNNKSHKINQNLEKEKNNVGTYQEVRNNKELTNRETVYSDIDNFEVSLKQHKNCHHTEFFPAINYSESHLN